MYSSRACSRSLFIHKAFFGRRAGLWFMHGISLGRMGELKLLLSATSAAICCWKRAPKRGISGGIVDCGIARICIYSEQDR